MKKAPMKTPGTTANGLGAEAATLYRRLSKEWDIHDGAGSIVLLTACQCLDRLRQAQKIIAEEGIVTKDRFGQSKPHAACQVEKEARAGLLMALKAMNLDLESLEVPEDAT